MALGSTIAPYELRFDAGRICLDLLATTHPEERLDVPEPLRAWIVRSGLVPAATPLAHVDSGWLVGFRELRGQVGQLVRRSSGSDTRTYDLALARVNDLARAAPPPPVPYAMKRACWCGSWTGLRGATRCSRSSRGTPWNCSPIPSRGPR